MSQSTKNTILENWPGPIDQAEPVKHAYHFALKQVGVSLDFHLEHFFKSTPVSFHHFENFADLTKICQRFPIDLILIGGKQDFMPEIEMLRGIKRNIFMSIIPVILYHPEPSDSIAIAAYENGADDIIYGEWIDQLEKVRIKQVIERSRRDLAINCSTRMPGTTIIEQEISRLIEMGDQFAVCYADLDFFKAFNDYYGYVYGDKIIKLTARIIKDTVFDLCRSGFVGHIAGDDFIFIISTDQIDPICSSILKTFDAIIPYRYQPEDRERGWIETLNRRGETEKFKLLTMSIAVLPAGNRQFAHVGEMSRMLADLKNATKSRPGSNYMVERRQPY